MDVSLGQLRTLAAVIDEGSFDGAARALGVTASAVSQRIKTLEAQTGRVLVTRSKPVRATRPGDLVLRLARATTRLAADTAAELGLADSAAGYTRIPIAVNNDSLNTWFLPALARMPARHRVCFDLHADDQDYSYQLFAQEAVLAAVTSIADPVPGCVVQRLGTMRYEPMASADFIEANLGGGPDSLRTAPVVQFDRKDSLQNATLRALFGDENVHPPAHYVPASADYRRAVELGLGWGMIPRQQFGDGLVALTGLLGLDRSVVLDVTLYWQCWNIDSPVLRALTEVVLRTAAEHLD